MSPSKAVVPVHGNRGKFRSIREEGYMANPQLEEGHLGLAHEIVESLAKIRISGTEWQLLWVILRKTYGWHKKLDVIPLSQFHALTGLPKPHIIRYLSKLLHKKIIFIAKIERGSTVYGFNKDFDKWVPLPKKAILSKKTTNIAQIDNEPCPKRQKSLPKKGPSKDNKELDQKILEKIYTANTSS